MLPKRVFFCGYFHTSSSCSSSVSTTQYKGVKWDEKHVDMVENYSLTEGIQHILVKEMSFFWEVSGTSVQGNQNPRTARLTPPFSRSLRKDQHHPVHPKLPSAIASVGVIWWR